MLYRLRTPYHGLSTQQMLCMYTLLTRPILEYAAPVFVRNHFGSSFRPMEQSQRRALRLATGASPYCSSRSLDVDTGVMPLRDRMLTLALRYRARTARNTLIPYLAQQMHSRTIARSFSGRTEIEWLRLLRHHSVPLSLTMLPVPLFNSHTQMVDPPAVQVAICPDATDDDDSSSSGPEQACEWFEDMCSAAAATCARVCVCASTACMIAEPNFTCGAVGLGLAGTVYCDGQAEQLAGHVEYHAWSLELRGHVAGIGLVADMIGEWMASNDITDTAHVFVLCDSKPAVEQVMGLTQPQRDSFPHQTVNRTRTQLHKLIDDHKAEVTVVYMPASSGTDTLTRAADLAKQAQQTLAGRTPGADIGELPWGEGLCLNEMYMTISDLVAIEAQTRWAKLSAYDCGLKCVYEQLPARTDVRAQWQACEHHHAGPHRHKASQDHHLAVLRGRLRMACSRLHQHSCARLDQHSATRDPFCDHCNDVEETTEHYVLHCPAYDDARKRLFDAVVADGVSAGDVTLAHVFSCSERVRSALNDFIVSTRRLWRTAGN